MRDLVASAFQSAGQRCSAARILYLQRNVADGMLGMLCGAMDELRGADPWDRSTDIGPIITAEAHDGFEAYVARAVAEGRLIHRAPTQGAGHHFAPALIRVGGIAEMDREVFGPALHVATFPAGGIDAVVDAVNARGYGLTMGLHSRIEDVARPVERRARVGNLYVNRNQIGAIVGSQPFGGEGLSGTGPEAGGPAYVPRFTAPARVEAPEVGGAALTDRDVQAAIDAIPVPADPIDAARQPGPTGERNVLRRHARGVALCLGPGAAEARAGRGGARGGGRGARGGAGARGRGRAGGGPRAGRPSRADGDRRGLARRRGRPGLAAGIGCAQRAHPAFAHRRRGRARDAGASHLHRHNSGGRQREPPYGRGNQMIVLSRGLNTSTSP